MTEAHGANLIIKMQAPVSCIQLPDYMSHAFKYADVVSVGPKVLEDIKVDDVLLLPESVYGWEQDDGTTIIREAWILGKMEE
jgi:hypothetical protein